MAAGGALAVDRDAFSAEVTRMVESCENITVHREQVEHIDASAPILVATGPLTDGALADEIGALTGDERLHFYDAVAPIVTAESLDYNKVFAASRYDRGEADYLNCPFNKEEYENFHAALASAERAPLHDFDTGAEQSAQPDPDAHGKKADTVTVYEGCMPIEIMAARGADTMRFGPLRPVGLVNPNTGHRPWANVQLRAENKERTLYNIVGFQTNLKWGEQKRVFSMIPGLENAEFVRYGVMHRNTFLDAPRVLSAQLCLKEHPNVFFAGQITGFEGYMESAACGLLAAQFKDLVPINRHYNGTPAGRQRAARPACGYHVRRTGAVPDHREQALPAHGREYGHPSSAAGGEPPAGQAPALHGTGSARCCQLPALAG